MPERKIDQLEKEAHLFCISQTQINFKYIMTSYGMALLMVGFIVITFLSTVFQKAEPSDYGILLFLLISWILFPFARIAYDIPIGFRLNHFVEHNVVAYGHYIAGIIYFLVLFVTIVLAPFGILYLVIKGIQYHGQILEKKDREHEERDALKKEVTALRKEIAQQNETHKDF